MVSYCSNEYMNQCNKTRIEETRRILEVLKSNLTEVRNGGDSKIEKAIHDAFKAMEDCLM